MSSTLIVLLVLAGLAACAALWGVAIYNRLVTLRNRFANAFSQIDVQLKRRHDLIPNLVESAKAYLAHERQTLEAVTAARQAAAGARAAAAADPANGGAMGRLVAAEGALGGALGRLFAVAESYPQLKADATIRALMEELTSSENKVAFARQAYNDAVMAYNTQRELFPALLIAGPAGFQPAILFAIDQAAQREAPQVRF